MAKKKGKIPTVKKAEVETPVIEEKENTEMTAEPVAVEETPEIPEADKNYLVFGTEDFELFSNDYLKGRVATIRGDELPKLFEELGDGDYTVVELAGRAEPKVIVKQNFETLRKKVRKPKVEGEPDKPKGKRGRPKKVETPAE